MWRRFFPPRIELAPSHLAWLEELFPSLPMNRVRFYAGLPLVPRLLRPEAIVLPGLWSWGQIRVYLRRGAPRPGRPRDLGLLAHEMVHVRQVCGAWQGYGLGFLRPFYVAYLCLSLRGYLANPLEREAFDFQARVEERMRDEDLADLLAAPNEARRQEGLEAWRRRCGDLRLTRSACSMRREIWRSTWGIALPFALGLSALIALLWPLVDLVTAGLAGAEGLMLGAAARLRPRG